MKMLVGLTLLLAAAGSGLSAAGAGEPAQALPPGVPDFTDTETLAHFTPVAQGSLWGNPDFPVLLIQGVEAPDSGFVLVVLDARNGKETWSLVEDPVILVTVGQRDEESPTTYVDEGFVTQGVPSGAFVEVAGATLSDLPSLLEGGYAAAASRQSL
jgi:hypothetical protein